MSKLYRKVLRLSTIYSLGSLGQNALAVILLPLYTSYLSPTDYGILALLELTTRLITRLVSPPINSAFNRFYYKPSYSERRGLLLFNLIVALLIKTTLLAALYWLLSGFLLSALFSGDQQLRFVVLLYGTTLVLEPLSELFLVYLRLREWARYFTFVSLAKVILSAGVVIYLLTQQELGLLAVIYGQIFNYLFVIVTILLPVLKELTPQFSLSILKEPLRFGYPLTVSSYSSMLLHSGDRYILNGLTSVSDVGLYSFGYRIATVLDTLLIIPISQAVYPTIYQKENNPEQQKQFIVTTALYYYVIGIFVTLGLSLYAKEAIMLLASQPEFWPAWTVVPVIAFSYMQNGLGRFFSWGTLLRNKSRHLSIMVLVSAVANIGLNLILIPVWGIMGAAFATLFAYLIWNGLALYYSLRFYDLRFPLYRFGHVSVIGIGLYVLSLPLLNGDSLPTNVIFKSLFLAAYPLLLLLTSFLTQEEKIFLQKLKVEAYTRLRKATPV